jgi:hypothetical protein
MAVITSPSDEEFRGTEIEELCVACRNRPITYPYIFWSARGGDFVLCGECCHTLKRGLIADLIHASAIKDVMALGHGHFTLEKKRLPAIGGNPSLRVKAWTATLRQTAGRKA